ncbi:carbohydrate ABC transporter permease [Diplocloster modestus]|uniref:Carbohydrate ABC transporter permease n=1 Tax=Diplocloster modestus TaxID=2850322 RepID=A0ABS6K6T8_9FIRM|nr:carbohydrate ABC transporter permease [Diplocloster modestus]MBU9726261.1 carbohydrate ABC transporter permease [Diplocloster modestus]
MNRVKKAGNTCFHFLVNLAVMLFSLSCILPILWMINSSLRDNKDFMQSVIGLATKPAFHNYVEALQTGDLWHCFLNSGYLSILTVILTIAFSFTVGFMVSRYRFFGSRLIYLLFISGMVIPILSLMVPVFIEFKKLNLLNHWFTLLFPYVSFAMPLSVLLMENFIKTIPRELDEAAYMEGCNFFQMMWRVIFPLCKPIVSVVVITSFISAWNEYPFSLILIGDENLRTISIGIRFFGQAHSFNYTLYFAALVISIAPILILYAVFSKHIMKGMTMGAVKG